MINFSRTVFLLVSISLIISLNSCTKKADTPLRKTASSSLIAGLNAEDYVLYENDFTKTKRFDERGIMEQTDIYEPKTGIVHRWYRAGDIIIENNSFIGYSWSLDGIHFYHNQNPVITDFGFPVAFKYNDNYYLIANYIIGEYGDLYLFNATAPQNPIMMNNEQPVFKHSQYGSSCFSKTFNPAADVDSKGRIHLMIEGQCYSSFHSVYAYTDFVEMNFNAHISETITIPSSGNHFLRYIPEKNSLMDIYGEWSTADWRIGTAIADVSKNLLDKDNWQIKKIQLEEKGIHLADPNLTIIQAGESKKAILSVSYAQEPIYSYVANEDLLSFFDKVNSEKIIEFEKLKINPTDKGYSMAEHFVGAKYTIDNNQMKLSNNFEFTMPIEYLVGNHKYQITLDILGNSNSNLVIQTTADTKIEKILEKKFSDAETSIQTIKAEIDLTGKSDSIIKFTGNDITIKYFKLILLK